MACDKNIGSAIISYSNYIKISEEHLNDESVYLKNNQNPLNYIVTEINNLLEDNFINGNISNDLLKHLLAVVFFVLV